MATAVKDKPARQAKRDEAPGPKGDAQAAVGGSVVIDAGVLAGAMKHAASIVAAAQTMPILGFARLVASDAGLEITTSDLDTEFRQVLPVTQPGTLATCADARRLSALAGAVDAKAAIRLTQDAEGHRLTVQSGRSRWVLPTLPPADFPAIPFDDAPGTITLAGKMLAELVATALPAMETNPHRPDLCCVFLHEDGGLLRTVATDGLRGHARRSAAAWPDGAPDVQVPPKFARTVERVLSDHGGDIDLVWDGRKLRVVAGGITLTGKLIAGKFPPYRDGIPELRHDTPPCRDDRLVRVEPEALRAAIRRVDLVSDTKERAVVLTPGEGTLTIEMRVAGNASWASEEIAAQCAPGPAWAHNAPSLLDALAAVGGDSIELRRPDDVDGPVKQQRPVRIQRTVPDGCVAVVVPMLF